MTSYERYLETYSGRELLKQHSLREQGIWCVRGEDPNCDLGGPHHEPMLGYFEGTLEDVIREAVELPSFWTWGGGGRITKQSPPSVRKANPEASARKRSRIAELEAELAKLKSEQ